MFETQLASVQQISAMEVERLLFDLVSTPSLSGSEGDASRLLVNWMAQRGFEAHVDDSGSAVGIRGAGAREVVLLGHIDTVPGALPVYVEGRVLHGRGSVDAKGPLAAFAAAAAMVDPPDGTRLVVIGATEEEAATSRGARHALEQFHPKACLIGEPSRWDRITLAYKGRLLVDWSWEGPLAHSAGPVPTPAEHAVAFWRAVQAYAQACNQGCQGAFARLEPSLRALNSDQDGAYGSAHMQLSLRLPPGLTTEVVIGDLRELGQDANLAFHGREEAIVAPKSNLLTRCMLAAVRANGGRPRFVHKTGTSDMNVVGPEWNCPIVAYGPGDSSLDHTPEERLDLDEFQRAIAVLRDALNEVLLQV
jgi:LysW-gamma-L-lysine carboxypeptidase